LALSIVAPQLAVAAGSSVAIVANLGGALTVRSASGGSHDVGGAQPLRSGDTIMTGVNALASINLAGAMRARLGTGTVAQYFAHAAAPTLRLESGSLCVAADIPSVAIAASDAVVTAVDAPAVFDVSFGPGGTRLALYAGSISTAVGGGSPLVLHAPAAMATTAAGGLATAAFDATAATFAQLPCPDRADAIAKAQVVPSPEPTSVAGASGGGGGGGGGVLGILAGIVGLAAIAGGHGGGGGGGSVQPPPLPSPSPGTLQVAPTSISLVVGGPSQTVAASEINLAGPISASAPDPAVATVSPPSHSSPATFTVSPVGPGSTSFAVTDGHGASVTVSVSVGAPGALTVSPTDFHTVPVNATGLLLNVSESNYDGAFSVTPNHPNVVTVGGGGNGPTPPPYLVTPQAAGSAMISVKDSLNHSVAVPITIAGPINDQPNQLNAITGPTNFLSTDPFYAGTLTATAKPAGIVSIAGGGTSPATFTVTPVAQGNTIITVSDSLGQKATVPVSVSTGGLVLNPTSLTFSNPAGQALTFNATEPNYTGFITPSGCPSTIVGVSPTVGTGPSQTFTVTSAGPGTCTLTVVTGDHTANESITVFGDLVVTPTALMYGDINVHKTVTIAEQNYTGSFNVANNTCGTIATVGNPSSGGPNATLDVQSKAAGSCSFQIDDDHGGSMTVSVTVGPFGSPSPSPASLSLSLTNPLIGTFTVTESGYAGSFRAASLDCAPFVTFNPGPATSFTVHAVAAGSCTIRVTDDHGGSAPVAVSVAGSLMVSPTSHTFTDVGLTTQISISEQNYAGLFTIANTAGCAGIVTFSALSGNGPIFSLGVTSAGGGNCTFDVQDVFGASTPVTVTVGPFGSIVPTPNPLTLDAVVNMSGTVTVSESGYAGLFTPTSTDCSGIATFPSAGFPSTLLVTQAGAGTCHIQIADDHGGSATETVVVNGALMLAPNPLTFSDVNVTSLINVDEPNYMGTFTVANDTCAGIVATVGSFAGPGPSTTLSVTSKASGSCTFAVADTDGQSVTQTVNVGPFGPPTPSVTELQLNTVNPTSGTFTINEIGYTGMFTLTPSSACAGVAGVSPGSGNSSTTFTVTAGGTVGTCGIRIVDDTNQPANVEVEVSGGTMSVTPASLQFASSTSPAQTVTASDTGATVFVCIVSDLLDFSASVTSQSTGTATCTIAPTNANPLFTGTAQVTFTDSIVGSSSVVQVAIGVMPLGKHHRVALPGGPRHVPLPGGPKRVPKVGGRPSPAPVGRAPVQGSPLTPGGPKNPIVQPHPAPAVPHLPLDGGRPQQPGGAAFQLSAQMAMLSGPGQQATITISAPDNAGLISASSSAPSIASVNITGPMGPTRILEIAARAPGLALIRIVDELGHTQFVRVMVAAPAPVKGRPLPIPPKPAGPPRRSM
jgi:hypothetical protein